MQTSARISRLNRFTQLFRNADDSCSLAPVFGGVAIGHAVEMVGNNGFADLEPGLL
jgi:hypothetical protein